MNTRFSGAALTALLVAAVPAQETQPTTKPDAGAVRRRALAAEAAGERAKAAEAFLELTELEPGNPDWFVRAADNLGKVGRFNDAMDLLDGVRRRFDDAADILVMLAKTFHLKADSMVAEGIFDTNTAFYYEDTIRTAEHVLERDPTHREARLLVASACFQLGDLPRALREAEQAVTEHPSDYSANAMLGKVTLEMFVLAKRRSDEMPAEEVDALRARAETALAAAAAADSSRGYALARLGDIRAWSLDMPAALARYREALAAEPGVNVDHGWLRTAAGASDRIELYEGAAADYRGRPDAVEREAAILDWYAAQARYDAREWAKARAGFERALESIPDFDITHYWIMLSAYWAGDEQGAGDHAAILAERAPRKFADATRGDEQTTAILRGLAQRAFERGSAVECREINHVLALANDTVDDWNNYALLCRDTRKYAESLAAYRRALELETSPQLLNDAGVILQYHLRSPENLEIARGYYERAIELAEEMLASELSDEERERTRIGLRDAKNNLRRL